MKKIISLILAAGVLTVVLSGCLAEPPKPAASDNTATPPATTPANTDNNNTDSNDDNNTDDAVSSASPKETSDGTALVNGLSENGYWIMSMLSDITLTETLHVDGVFYNRDDTSGKVYRKFAMNTQDASYTVIDRFTLTVPEIIITSPNFFIQHGTIKGNVHVNAEGFAMTGVEIQGNLTYETQEQMDGAKLQDCTVTGTTGLADAAVAAGNVEVEEPEEVAAEDEPEATPEPAAATATPAATPTPAAATATPAASTATPQVTATPESTPTPTPAPTPTPTPAPTPEPADTDSEATSGATE